MDVYYGHRSAAGYSMEPLPGFQKMRTGVIRIAASGRNAAIVTSESFYAVEIPR
jgi:hypothetical protein